MSTYNKIFSSFYHLTKLDCIYGFTYFGCQPPSAKSVTESDRFYST